MEEYSTIFLHWAQTLVSQMYIYNKWFLQRRGKKSQLLSLGNARTLKIKKKE